MVHAGRADSFPGPWRSCSEIDFSGGKVLYLSDLQPESVAWNPYFHLDSELPILSQFYAPRQDRTLEMMPLRWGEKNIARAWRSMAARR